MSKLETLIRERARRGEISHIGLVADGRLWRASFAASHLYGVSTAEDADPIAALVKAIDAPSKSRTRNVEKPNAKAVELEDDDFG